MKKSFKPWVIGIYFLILVFMLGNIQSHYSQAFVSKMNMDYCLDLTIRKSTMKTMKERKNWCYEVLIKTKQFE